MLHPMFVSDVFDPTRPIHEQIQERAEQMRAAGLSVPQFSLSSDDLGRYVMEILPARLIDRHRDLQHPWVFGPLGGTCKPEYLKAWAGLVLPIDGWAESDWPFVHVTPAEKAD
jgi:hypothetical protein